MKNQDQVVQEEMRKLIKRSCKTNQNYYSKNYNFQKVLLKFFFNSADVTIDYDRQLISLWTGVKTDAHPGKLYDINEATPINIAYSNLEETLKGCLEKEVKQINFYTSLLFHYNQVIEERDLEAQSA